MVTEIRMYIEGDPALREGFGNFFDSIREEARKRRIRWKIILCNDVSATKDAYNIAMKRHPQSFNLLLVDADDAVEENLDGYQHRMVQIMESWFLADPEALSEYYGQGFKLKLKRHDVEAIPKSEVEKELKEATRNCSKGRYHKTKHAPKILAKIDPEKVQARAPHCKRLFETLRSKTQE